MQDRIWKLLLANLDWDGEGKALGIGYGNGALTVKLAQKYEEDQVFGIDYWGGKWEYSKNTCERNAEIEGVNDRVKFQKAGAVSLPFDEGISMRQQATSWFTRSAMPKTSGNLSAKHDELSRKAEILSKTNS